MTQETKGLSGNKAQQLFVAIFKGKFGGHIDQFNAGPGL
jgi:hypothetical protein